MKTLLTIFLLFPLFATSQDVTGIWLGYIKTPGSQLEFEIGITDMGNKLVCYSLINYPKDGTDNIGVKTGKVKRGKREITIEDDELIYENFTITPIRMKVVCELVFQRKDTADILYGTFKTRSIDFRDTRTYNGEVYLKKFPKLVPTKIMTKLYELNLVNKLSFINAKEKKEVPSIAIVSRMQLSERKVEKIREISFSSDSLRISVVDNGTVDGDTISLMLNGKLIAEKKGLTVNAFKITIPTKTVGDSMLLVMHAESLGTIPPNTGLLIIEDGVNRYEIRFSGDLQRSSAVLLRRK